MNTKEILRRLKSFSRKFHRFLSPIAVILLLLTSTSGILYIILEYIFQVPKDSRKWLMDVHQGRVASDYTRIPYTILNALLILSMAISGFFLIRKGFWTLKFYQKKTWKFTFRQVHQKFSSFMFIWLSIVAVSGALYRTLRTGFNVDKKYTSWLLWLHCGNFNVYFMFVYTSLLFIGTIILIVTGLVMYYRYMRNKYTRSREKERLLDPQQGAVKEQDDIVHAC